MKLNNGRRLLVPNFFSYIGEGSILLGILTVLFAIVGAINLIIAIILWIKAFVEWNGRIAKTMTIFWILNIIATFGWMAIMDIMPKLIP